MFAIRSIHTFPIAALLCVSLPLLASAQMVPGGDVPARTFDDARADAVEQREAGDHASAARSFVAAYGALSAEERVGARGEFVVSAAVDDFRLAQQANPDDLSLLQEETEILEHFDQERTKARSEGRSEATPEWLLEELMRVRRRTEELARASRASQDDNSPQEQEAAPDVPPPVVPPPDEKETNRKTRRDDRPDRQLDVELLGGGLAAFVVGTSLIAGGAYGRANTRDETESNRYGLSNGLMITGVVATAAGIGLVGWGAVRMKKRNEQRVVARLLVPSVSRSGFHISVSARF